MPRPRPCCLCRLQFGFLMVLFSLELSSATMPRKLCGRHLLMAIEKLCGLANWSTFDEKTFHWQLLPRAVVPEEHPRTQEPFPIRGTNTKPVSTAVFMEAAIRNMKIRPRPGTLPQKSTPPPDNTREFSSSYLIPYSHEIVGFQEKTSDKMKTLSSWFWGNHPQRKRRGYSEKCCLKGCTKEELSIACFPYVDYRKLEMGHQL
ncbi:insulin-like peptide INSL6 [Echinops telfairi]|uniref:Insulin-like peptide INSL6 n=1 Tax=Echinops telfairi TaxID=9371 RepID=A0ABM0ZTB0_ECHTE|nr:insulin-like peptide INSL6 [Echinops telfairi]